MNLSGLSATYPGYSAQEDSTATTQQNQYKAREAAIKLLGAHVLGAALAGGQPGPQAPPPGQPSVPSAPAPPPSPAAIPQPMAQGVPPGGAPAAPQPPPAISAPSGGGAPPAPVASGAPPEISLQALTARILQTAPNVRNHPEILLAALERASPMLDRQGKEDIAEIRNKFTEQRLKLLQERIDEATRHHDLVSADKKAAQDAINERTGKRIEATDERFNRKNPNSPAVGIPTPDSPPTAPITQPSAGSAPPAAMLKPNTITTFQNGQKWTLGPDGQPKQVP